MTKKIVLDAKNVYYRQLNERIRKAVKNGSREIEIKNVNGQRYLCGAVKGKQKFLIRGVPGQDMASFMKGPYIRVEGNAQDGVGNTMDDGKVVVNGLAGDVLGYGMRGGRLYIKEDVGYRVGIHMKAYMDKLPVIIIGGKAGDFLGEYMAGGVIVLLGMFTGKPKAPIAGRSLGTGMHGGVIYVRGKVPREQIGPGLSSEPVNRKDKELLAEYLADYAKEFGLDQKKLLAEPFVKIKPFSHRPYGDLYVGTN